MSYANGAAGIGRRLLLKSYPRQFRREHGEQILAFWSAQRRESRYRGGRGAVLYEYEIARDALRDGLRMRWGGVGRTRMVGAGGRSSPRASAGAIMLTTASDVRYALRYLRASPLFSIVAVATLVLGIGTNTAIFGIVDGVLLRPLPYPQPERLVALWRAASGVSTVSIALPEFHAFRDRGRGFEAVTATMDGTASVQWDGEARRHRVVRASADYFRVFGSRPVVGRFFTADEDTRSGPSVAVISDRLWRDRFGADPAVVGRSVIVEQKSHVIVGVVRGGPDHPTADTDIWLPLQDAQVLLDIGMNPDTRDLVYLTVYARLAEGVTPADATAEVDGMMRLLNEDEGRDAGSIGGWAESLHEATVGGSRSSLLLMLGAVGLLLAIVCANVAGLWLTRVAARTHEVALRAALGARRARIMLQLLTESLVIAIAGGAGGVLLARAMTRLLIDLAPETLPRRTAVTVDSGVVVYAAVTAAACGLLIGFVPAIRAIRLDPAATLRGSRDGAAHAGRGLQRALVVTQVAVAVVLLSGAMLLANSYVRLVLVDPGFEPDRVLTTQITPPFDASDTEEVRRFYADLLERIRGLPGVASASTTYSPPMAQSNFQQTVLAEHMEEPEPEDREWVGTVIIGTDYLETVGVPLLRGRPFRDDDRLGQEHVAIVNTAMADRLWPDEDPVGKRFRLSGGLSGSADSLEREFFPSEWITVVGVVGNVRRRDLGLPAVAEFYRPHAQMSWPSSFLVVKTERAPPGFAEALRRAVWEVDAGVPVEEISSLGELLRASVAAPRFRLVLMSFFAAVACFLAMLGVYAVMTLTVGQRTHEIGVRMALGARQGLVLRAVLLDGLKLAAAGLALGSAAAFTAGRLLSATLYAITPHDPATHAGVVVVTLGVALVACYVPARRAARLDAMRALRRE